MAAPNKPTVKQQREARRAEKVAAMKRQQAAQRRNQRLGLIGGIAAGVLVLALIVVFVVTNPARTPATGDEPDPTTDRESIEIEGLETFGDLAAVHIDPDPVDYEARYGMLPPAGGDHHGAWLNCGVYSEPQQNENAVHSLEHGAVWVTYDPERVDAAGVDTLRAALPSTYSILSPYPGLPSPVFASAWSAQVQLDGPDDERLEQFVQKFWQAGTAPEPGAPCTGALNGPGKVG